MPPSELSHDDHLRDLVCRLQPVHTPNTADRAHAWNEWLRLGGAEPVRKFIRWANGTVVEDDEIFQETLIVAFLKVERGQYEDRSLPFTAFLKKIAHYKILEAARWNHRQVPLEDVGEQAEPAEETQHEFDQAERWIEQSALREALNTLTPRRRSIMLMYELGYSTAEIAARFHIREELVRKEKSLGLRQLRNTLHPAAALPIAS